MSADTTAHAELSRTNRELVQQFYADVAAGRSAQAQAVMHPDIVVHEPRDLPWGGEYIGAEGQKKLGELQADAVTQGFLDVHGVYADGDVVISELTIKATKSGEQILLSERMHVVDGQILEQRVYLFGHHDRPVAELF